MKRERKGKEQRILACPVTDKIGFSEAQASRRVGKYDEIVRYYHCDGCNLFHLTSESISATLGRHLLTPEEENVLLKKQNSELSTDRKQMKKTINRLSQTIRDLREQLKETTA